MKQCPVCKSTYTDDTLVFCLNDGGKLFSPSATAVTQEMSFGNRQTFSSEQKTFDNYPTAPTIVAQKKNKSVNLIIILAIFGFIGLVMGAIWLTRYYVLQKNAQEAEILKSGRDPAERQNGDDTRELREKLDKLEKQLEQQKSANKNAPTVRPPTPAPNVSTVSGTVNSPNDGFLALRSAPNHKTGAQLAQIPHGAVIFVSGCQNSTYVGDRRGRWCQTTYGGKTGWIFDGFLVY